MKAIIEITAICVVSVLLVIFASLYFTVTKRQKKLNSAANNLNGADNNNKTNQDDIDDITVEWAEQLQIMRAQIDLMCELSPVFIVCCDYGRDCFSVSENGQIQLGLIGFNGATGVNGVNGAENADTEQIDQKKFEELIHPDDMFIYEEITGSENIRNAELAESPYVLRLRQADSQDYNKYLTRIKPVYSETGIPAALVLAFINAEYFEK